MAEQAASQACIAQLKANLPSHTLLVAEEDMRPYECDGLSAYRRLPLAVALPETVEQVQDIVKI